MKISDIIVENRTRKQLGDLQQLADSISSIGLLHPIVVTPNNRLVSGYRRIKAFQLLGKDEIPHRIVHDLDDFLLVLAEQHENTCRLDFTPSEAVEIGKMLEPLERKAAKGRQGTRSDLEHGENFTPSSQKSLDKVSSTIGMSRPTYTKAKSVVEFAQENPKYDYIVKEMDETGKIDRAAKEMRRVQKLEARQEIAVPIDSNVWHGDFREMGKKIPDNSVDLIFTDPPYGQEYLFLYQDLGIFAARVLKPGGLCLVYSGQGYLLDKMNHLGENLEYVWCFAIQHSGQRTQIYYRNVSNVWKPVLAYCKPPLEVWWKTMPDMQTGYQEKASHEWQQSLDEATFYVKNLCPPKGLVIDPFCGSGTTLVAAKNLGLSYIGIEEDIEDVNIASERLINDQTATFEVSMLGL